MKKKNMWGKDKLNGIQLRLLLVFSVAVMAFYVLTSSRNKTMVHGYPEMLRASEKMTAATAEIRTFREELGLPINPRADPNRTGFIGVEISPLTTTLGNLEAKQTALNPDFSALILRWLRESGLRSGDRVALQLSGSFPALNIAAIIACETLELEPLISSSVGASSYGANMPELTYLDMERRLFERGIIHHLSELVTGGGTADRGDYLWEESGQILRRIGERTGYSILYPASLQQAVQMKREFFNERGPVRGFINVGGNHSSLGNCSHSSRLPVGLLVQGESCRHADRGLIQHFREENIPVIHLLNIRSVAVRHSLSLLPMMGQPAGTADIYFEITEPRWLKIVLGILLLFSWMLLGKFQWIPRSFRTTSTSSSW